MSNMFLWFLMKNIIQIGKQKKQILHYYLAS